MKSDVIWSSVVEPSQYPFVWCWSAVVYRGTDMRARGWALTKRRALAKRNDWLFAVGESPS